MQDVLILICSEMWEGVPSHSAARLICGAKEYGVTDVRRGLSQRSATSVDVETAARSATILQYDVVFSLRAITQTKRFASAEMAMMYALAQ